MTTTVLNKEGLEKARAAYIAMYPLDGIEEAIPAYLSASLPTDVAGVVERLEQRAKEDEECADNSRVVADLLSPELARFNERADTGWNTYAVRMAVDHRNSMERDRRYANDLREAAALISALSADNERQRKNTAEAIREGLAAVADMRNRAEASDARARELEADKAFTAEIASKAIKFKLGEIYVESRGPNAWVVSNGSSVRNSFGEWEWEPMPSNRDEDFISRTRLPFRDAWELARSVAKEAGNNG